MSADLTTIKRAAVSAALSAGLFATVMFAAPLGVFGMLLAPLPVAYVAWSCGLRAAFATALAAAGVIVLLFEPFYAAEYLIQFGIGGMVLGHGTRRDRPPQWTVGIFAALSLALFLVFLEASAVTAGTDPFGAAAAMTGEWVAPLREALNAPGQDPKTQLAVQEYLQTVEWSLKNIPFGLVAGFGVVAGWFVAAMLRRFVAARGAVLTPWTAWTAPHWWIWLPIAAGAVTFFTEGKLKLLGLNVLVPAGVVYFLQGVAILEALMGSWSTPGLVRAFVIALVFIEAQVFGMVLALLGAFDQWLDARSRFAPRRAGQ